MQNRSIYSCSLYKMTSEICNVIGEIQNTLVIIPIMDENFKSKMAWKKLTVIGEIQIH